MVRNELVKSTLCMLLCLCSLCMLLFCDISFAEENERLEILHHSENTVDDAWPWIYQKGCDIPGYVMSIEEQNDFIITIYRSIYEYDTMHPTVIIFVDQPEAYEPCAYGYHISTPNGDFYGGYDASPWHCVLLNSPTPVEVTLELFLFGENGNDILHDLFQNHHEAQMVSRSTASMSYTLLVTTESD